MLDTHTNEFKRDLVSHTDPGTSVAFSPDGTVLASGSSDDTIKIWEVESGNLLNTFKEPIARNVTHVAFSPDGHTIAGSSLHVIRLWDITTGKIMETLIGHTTWIRSVAFSPDGRMLASTASDGTTILWDVIRN